MTKIDFSNTVFIEASRRCNMICDHCLRGPAENLEIPTEYLEEFFSKASYISSLGIGGGEPTLAVKKIREIIRIAKKHNVEIGSFDITTNGKVISDDFMVAIIELYNYCSDNEMSFLGLSTDHYHESISDDNICKLQIFKFFSKRLPYNDRTELINDGYAEINGIGRREDKIYGYEIDTDYQDDIDRIEDGFVYLNCKGNIIPTCDMGYERQDEEENIVCHVSEMSIEKFSDFNVKLNGGLVDNIDRANEIDVQELNILWNLEKA